MTKDNKGVFTTTDTLDEFFRCGLNRRTLAAWEAGVQSAARGEGRYTYANSASDYRLAYVLGRAEAQRRFDRSERWRCPCCHCELLPEAPDAR